jgi:hypothetical protein
MLDAARAALVFTSGRTRDDLSADLMLQFALVRALEIVGEAAARMMTALSAGRIRRATRLLSLTAGRGMAFSFPCTH